MLTSFSRMSIANLVNKNKPGASVLQQNDCAIRNIALSTGWSNLLHPRAPYAHTPYSHFPESSPRLWSAV